MKEIMMKRQCKRWLYGLFVIFTLLLSACAPHTADPGLDTETPQDTVPVVVDLGVVEAGQSEYSVIISEYASDAAVEAGRGVMSEIHAKTGVKMNWSDDYIATGDPIPAKEILIGLTARKECLSVMGDLPYGEYAIRVVGEKIVIAAWDDASLERACAAFVNCVRKSAEDGQFTVAGDYTAIGVGNAAVQALPHYGAPDEDLRFVDLGDACYMLYAKNTDADEFGEYLKVLETAGYTRFAYREFGKNLHAVYTSEEKIIHASYTAKDKDARISIDDAYDMTLFTEQPHEKVCEPSVTLVGQEGYMNDTEGVPNQIGLCLIFRLEDGRFIVVDGGDYVPAAGPMIYRELKKLAVDPDNIVIAAWFLTHAHSDHTGGFVHFTEDLNYHKRVKIECIVHHLVTPEQYDTLGDPGQSQRVRNLLRREFSKIPVIKAHTGQLFRIGGMEIEMLFTYEDLEPSPLEYQNTSSLVFRVTCQDNTVLVLGDASNRSCSYLVRSYGDYLKSDIVQISHHGYTGGTIPLYNAISAEVALWPCGVASIDGSYESLLTRDYNAKAVELAKEVYIAGKLVRTLTLPYTPDAQNESKIMY